MKRKVLAVALSLALLASLFAFTVPVSADPDGAADQAGFIYFEIKLGGWGGGASPGWTLEWHGTPVEYAGKVMPEGNIYMLRNYTWHFTIAESTFGTGTATSIFNATDNWKTGKRQVQQIWIFEFDDEVNGSITINRQAHYDFVSWSNTNPASTSANWEGKVHRVINRATGDLKGFHFSDFDNNLGTRWWWAIGHFAPGDSNPLP